MSVVTHAQNLVTNGDFEIYSQCPNNSSSGKTLVISPGVIVEFASSTDTTLLNTSAFGSLWVKGKILAEGITFKAMGNGYWKGIKFDENCDKTGSIRNSLIQDAFYQIDLGW